MAITRPSMGTLWASLMTAAMTAGLLVSLTIPLYAQDSGSKGPERNCKSCGLHASKDVGYQDRASLIIPEGDRTLHLELVPEMALIRKQSTEDSSASAAMKALGDDLLSEVASQGYLSEARLDWVTAREGSTVVESAKANYSTIADYLQDIPQIAFSGPVFKLGDRYIATSDNIIVQFNMGVSEATQRDFFKEHRVEFVSTSDVGYARGTVATSNGYEVINRAIEMNADPIVQFAGVDWVGQYTTENYMDDFNGTSAAAPMVAGVAALVLSQDNTLEAEAVIARVKNSGNSVGSVYGDLCLGDCSGTCPPADVGFDYGKVCLRGLILSEDESGNQTVEKICPCQSDVLVDAPADLPVFIDKPGILPDYNDVLTFPEMPDPNQPTNIPFLIADSNGEFVDTRVIGQDEQGNDEIIPGIQFIRCADGDCPSKFNGKCSTCNDGGNRDATFGCVKCQSLDEEGAKVFRTPHEVYGCLRCQDGLDIDPIIGCDRCSDGSVPQLDDLGNPVCPQGETYVTKTIIEDDAFNMEYRPGSSYEDLQLIEDDGSEGPVFNTDVRPYHLFSPYLGTGIVNALKALDPDGVLNPFPYSKTNLAQGDPLYPYEWHLDIGAPYASGPQPDAVENADMDVPEAWWIQQPDPNVIVGVIDDGVAVNHPDLNVVAGLDGQDITILSSQHKSSTDHGTAVAGIIAAEANGIGTVGVAPGLPIVGVRIIEAPREGYSLAQGSSLFNAFKFVVDNGAGVINNSWGIPYTNDPCDDGDDLPPPDSDENGYGLGYFPMLSSEKAGIDYATAFGRGGLGSVIVFAAGNDRALADGYEMLAKDCLNVDLPMSKWWGAGYGKPTREAILAVAASNNVARRIWYSNYGSAIDVAGPSGDFFPDHLNFECAEDIWEGGELGIVTTSTNLLHLGGHDDAFEAVPGYPFGSLGFTGYYDYSGFDYQYLEAYNNTFKGQGILIQTANGSVELHPMISAGPDGVITGVTILQVRDPQRLVTQQIPIVTTGKIKFKRSGTAQFNEKLSSSFTLSGSGSANGISASFSAKGKESFQLLLGNVFDESKHEGYLVKTKVKIDGVGSLKGLGLLYRANTGGSFPDREYGPNVPFTSFLPSNATIYSPTMTNGGGGNTTITGNAAVDWAVGAILGGGQTSVKVKYSDLLKQGSYKAAATNGMFRAKSQGVHTADGSQPFFELIDATHWPEKVQFSTPAVSTKLTNLHSPERPFN